MSVTITCGITAQIALDSHAISMYCDPGSQDGLHVKQENKNI